MPKCIIWEPSCLNNSLTFYGGYVCICAVMVFQWKHDLHVSFPFKLKLHKWRNCENAKIHERLFYIQNIFFLYQELSMSITACQVLRELAAVYNMSYKAYGVHVCMHLSKYSMGENVICIKLKIPFSQQNLTWATDLCFDCFTYM